MPSVEEARAAQPALYIVPAPGNTTSSRDASASDSTIPNNSEVPRGDPGRVSSDHTLANEPTLERDVERGEKQEREKPRGDGGTGGKEQKKEEKDPFLVTIEGREHLNPHTWNTTYRWFLTALGGVFTLNATFASSAPSQLIPSIIGYFHVGEEVGTLTIALFVAGYCVGPLFWGPLSERYGRKWVFIAGFVPYTAFQLGCALSKNIGSLLVFRFLGGCFAAAPLTNSGAIIADLWDAERRGIALAIFALAPFAGPAIAPIVSGALQVTGSDWRWIFWILLIFAGICLVAMVFILPETYVPYLLHKEAKRLRKETGDSRYYSLSEHPGQRKSFKTTLNQTVGKPFVMIVEEPMLAILTLYMAFIYGIVYLLFEALPIIFQEIHHLNAVKGALPFLGLPIGGTTAVIIYTLYFNKIYIHKNRTKTGKMVPPEERLKPLMVAAPVFALGFFLLGLCGAYESVSVWPSIIAVCIFGLCILWMFLSIFNYLIDAYLANAASALAINTVVRSLFGAGFPLFATYMYRKLGVIGASCLLGGLAFVFVPAPFVLYKYGRKIRSLSKNAKVLD